MADTPLDETVNNPIPFPLRQATTSKPQDNAERKMDRETTTPEYLNKHLSCQLSGLQPEPAGKRELASRSDLAMYRMAIKRRFPISYEKRKKMVAQCMDIMESSEAIQEHKLAAIKTLVAMDTLNAKREATDVQASKPGQTTNVNVQVNLTQAERVARVAALLGQAKPEEPQDK